MKISLLPLVIPCHLCRLAIILKFCVHFFLEILSLVIVKLSSARSSIYKFDDFIILLYHFISCSYFKRQIAHMSQLSSIVLSRGALEL